MRLFTGLILTLLLVTGVYAVCVPSGNDPNSGVVSQTEVNNFVTWFIQSQTTFPLAEDGIKESLSSIGGGDRLFVISDGSDIPASDDTCDGGCSHRFQLTIGAPTVLGLGPGMSIAAYSDIVGQASAVYELVVTPASLQKLSRVDATACSVDESVASGDIRFVDVDLNVVNQENPDPEGLETFQFGSDSPPDGDADRATCEGFGLQFDTDAPAIERCCGDDGKDHGRIFNNNLLCTMRSVGTSTPGWKKAQSTAGQVFGAMDAEYLSDGSTFLSEGASGITNCNVRAVEKVEYMYVTLDASIDRALKGRWLQCGPSPNEAADGGYNLKLGDKVLCDGQTYICAKNDATQVFEWATREEFEETNAENYEDTCRLIGLGTGAQERLSFVWTGTKCCQGTVSYEDPVTAQDLSTDSAGVYSSNGVCLFGRQFPNDDTASFKKNVPDYVANFGRLQGCGITGPDSIVVGHTTCDVLLDSTAAVSGVEPEPKFVCTYDGIWGLLAPGAGVDGLVLKESPTGSNLLRNPSFDRGVE